MGDRAEDCAVGGAGGAQDGVGEGGAVLLEGGEADGFVAEGEGEAEAGGGGVEDGEGGGGDLGTDAVAFEDEEFHVRYS